MESYYDKVIKVMIIIIKNIYNAQDDRGHKCAIVAEIVVVFSWHIVQIAYQKCLQMFIKASSATD